MHVLYIHQHFGTPAGSNGTRSYEFARRLIKAGHRVTMVCGASGRSASGLSAPFVKGRRSGIVDGIEVIEYQIGYSTNDGILTRMRKFIRFGAAASRIALAAKYDIIFATSTPLTAGIPGILARRFRGKKFVFEVRDLWPELPRALGVTNPLLIGGMSLLEGLSYRSARHVIGLSPGIVEGIKRRGIPADRVSMIPNGCDRAMFAQLKGPASFEDFGLPFAEDDFVCVYAGAHGIANGLDALVEVATELKARGERKVRMLLVGAGGTKAALQEDVAKRGLGDIVHFVDSIPKTQLVPLLKRCDAGLQILKNVPAFYHGTSPNKFFDYLAAGTPVIVNYPGWVADMVAAKDAGAVAPPEDPAAFADVLQAAARMGGTWQEKRANAAKLSLEFDRDRLGAKFVERLEAECRPSREAKLASQSR